MRTLLVVFAAFAALAAVATAMCDPWGARQCGLDFLNCTGPADRSGSGSAATAELSSLCACFEQQGECLKKYDCYSGAPYYIHHYDCMAMQCGEDVCGAASALAALPLLALVASALFAL